MPLQNEKFIVRKAHTADFKALHDLSIKHSLSIENNKLGIAQLVEKENLKNMYVIEKDNRIAGAFEIADFTEDDCKWYEVENPTNKKEIRKVFWDYKFRAHNLREILLAAIFKIAGNSELYTDIIYSPLRNTPSELLAKRCGFKLLRIKPYHSNEYGETEWLQFRLATYLLH